MNQQNSSRRNNQFGLVLLSGIIFMFGLFSVGWQMSQPVAPGPIQINARSSAQQAITPNGVILQRWPTLNTPQLLPNDRLIAINSIPLTTIAHDFLGRTFDRTQIAWQAGVPQQWTVLRDGASVDITVTPSPNPIGVTTRLSTIWYQYIIVLMPTVLCTLIYWRQPKNAVTPPLLLFSVTVSAYLILSTQQMRLIYWLKPFAYIVLLLPHWLLPKIATSALWHLLCVFPQPSDWFVQRRKRILFLIYGVPVVAQLGIIAWFYLQTDNGLLWFQQWWQTKGFVWQVQYVLLLPLVFMSWRRSRSLLTSRQQFRIFVSSILFFPIALTLAARIGRGAGYTAAQLGPLYVILGVLPFIGIYLAITQYRLFEIDRILNRSMVYGLLTALVALIYGVLISGSALWLLSSSPLPAALVATVIVALLLLPARQFFQRLINRLMYGQRDDPFMVLRQTADALQRPDPASALQQVADIIQSSLRVPFAQASINNGPAFLAGSAESNHPTWQTRMLANSAEMGTLTVMQRDESTPFTVTEVGLLQNIAQQAAAALHSNRVTAQLQQTHQQLITVRDDERKRIQRDLHDGLGPTLASMSMRIDAAQHLVGADPEKATDILGDLRVQTQGAVKDVRHMLSDRRPAILDELGLIAALQVTIDKFNEQQNIAISWSHAGLEQVVSAEIETTIYQVVNEGLTNVLKHANAQHATVTITATDTVTVSIEDDGVGIQPDVRAGIGVASLRRRLDQLSGQFSMLPAAQGGTRLEAILPSEIVI